jgi:hypothetical protein
MLACLLVLASLPIVASGPLATASAEGLGPSTRRINVPFASVVAPAPYPTQTAVFWFGQVGPTSNYADVRAIYDNAELRITVHVFDRLLAYDDSPSPAEFANWDAVSLYLNLDGNVGSTPGPRAHRFDGQLSHWQPRAGYQAAYLGTGSGWQAATTSFQTTSGWRANGFNDNLNDRGWFVKFTIPFSSLGLSAAPTQGATWGLAVAVHDRDAVANPPAPDTLWPENMSPAAPATWGQMGFGIPAYNRPPLLPVGGVTIRQGLLGANVPDAHVGGHTTCGSAYNPDFFNGWGDANYAGYHQINVQNQWDVADWPCFSKYYVTFPLDLIPPGRTIASAALTLHQFGGAWGAEMQPSWIQVLTVGQDWDEATLTWNNAPLALENISGAWVDPMSQWPGWPGLPHSWDVSRAVAAAYAAGEPLRLALYSADGAYHSGRYFSSSNTDDWNAAARPTLSVVWGVPPGSGAYHFVFAPLTSR